MNKIKLSIKKNRLLYWFYRIVYRIFATLYWNGVFFVDRFWGLKYKYGNCFVFTTVSGKIKKNNWGDDLNFYLFSFLSSDRIWFVPFSQLFFYPKGVIKYSLIGSIIGDFNLNNTVVYGSGAISSESRIIGMPQKLLSVRGPLTRDVFIKNGIDCPEVYGDPALLLPLVYKPKIKKTENIGIVPHYRTFDTDWADSKWLLRLKQLYSITVINMSRYDKWTDIVDTICSCKMIISESLHGIIVAETYGIPYVWVEIIPHNYSWEWDFKFLDFFGSIGKNVSCVKIYERVEFDEKEILRIYNEWKKGEINYKLLLEAFPFCLKGMMK